jgi:hypothetical protein
MKYSFFLMFFTFNYLSISQQNSFDNIYDFDDINTPFESYIKDKNIKTLTTIILKMETP